MPGKTITATDAARRFSDVLNPVRYQGVEFDTSGRRASRQHRAAPSAALGIRGGVFELFRPLPFDRSGSCPCASRRIAPRRGDARRLTSSSAQPRFAMVPRADHEPGGFQPHARL